MYTSDVQKAKKVWHDGECVWILMVCTPLLTFTFHIVTMEGMFDCTTYVNSSGNQSGLKIWENID